MLKDLSRFCLIGYRACGKSTVGRVLAERLDLPLFDTDELIVAEAGKPIAKIFEEDGEEAFRSLETEILRRILAVEKRYVLSTGGGVPVREENRRLIRESNAICVLFQARPGTILRRIQYDRRSSLNRPSLTPLEPEEEIRELLEQRAPFYKELADITLSTDTRSPVELLQFILLMSCRLTKCAIDF